MNHPRLFILPLVLFHLASCTHHEVNTLGNAASNFFDLGQSPQPFQQPFQPLAPPVQQPFQPFRQPFQPLGQPIQQPPPQPFRQPIQQLPQPFNQAVQQPQPFGQPVQQSFQPFGQSGQQMPQLFNQPVQQTLQQATQTVQQPFQPAAQQPLAQPVQTLMPQPSSQPQAVSSLGSGACPAQGSRFSQTFRFNNKEYWFSWQDSSNSQMDWTSAFKFCKQNCMNLVSLETQAEMEFTAAMINEGDLFGLWTSGRVCNFNACAQEPSIQPVRINGWVWANRGVKMNNALWAPTGGLKRPQPDNLLQSTTGESEDCVALLSNWYDDRSGGFHDLSCAEKLPFVCEKD